MTPAFPETGRTVYFGHLFVNGQPLNESPLKDHPLNPMHDANLVRVMARQAQGTVGLVDLTTVAAGPAAVKARLDDLRVQGFTAAIADAIAERDLETLGAVALRNGGLNRSIRSGAWTCPRSCKIRPGAIADGNDG